MRELFKNNARSLSKLSFMKTASLYVDICLPLCMSVAPPRSLNELRM